MEPLLGEIKLFPGNFAPEGWYTCEGQTLSISQNTALFSIIGTTYGGDGMTTFKLPDLRGAFPTQTTNLGGYHPGGTYNFGETGGNQNYTITSINMPPHTHSIVKGPGTNLQGSVGTPSVSISVNNNPGATPGPTGGNVLLGETGDVGGSGQPALYNNNSAGSVNLGGVTSSMTGTTLTFNPTGLTLTPWGSGPTPVAMVPNFVAMQYIIAYEGTYPLRP